MTGGTSKAVGQALGATKVDAAGQGDRHPAEGASRFAVELWTVSQAVNWIAFGTNSNEAQPTIQPNIGCGRFMSPEIMGALEAEAAGAPETWPPPGVSLKRPTWPERKEPENFPPEEVRKIVARWKIERDLDAISLYEFALSEKKRYLAEVDALRQLNSAVQAGKLDAFGRPSGSKETPKAHPPREQISKLAVDEFQQIDGWGWLRPTLEGGAGYPDVAGPFFYDIRIQASHVRRLWPRLEPSLGRFLPQPNYGSGGENIQPSIATQIPGHLLSNKSLMQKITSGRSDFYRRAAADFKAFGVRPRAGPKRAAARNRRNKSTHDFKGDGISISRIRPER